MILVGDLYQLPAFYLNPLYTATENINDEYSVAGAKLFQTFEIQIMNENVRQKADISYLDLLNNIKEKKVSVKDVELLNSRLRKNLSEEEIKLFEHDSVYIFPTNHECKYFNENKLKELGKPIVTIIPVQTPRMPLVDPDQTIKLADEAKIMLTQNLNVKSNLCNGTIGYVKAIMYDIRSIPNTSMPICIFCTFEKYTGRTCELNTIPIFPISDSYTDPNTNQKFTVRQFPLQLGWALTAHRTQSLSIPRISVSLSDREMFLNYTYTVLSRTLGLKDLMLLHNNLDISRFQSASFYSGFENMKKQLEKLINKQ